MIIEGSLSVKAALIYKRREVYTVYIDEKKDSKDINFIISECIRSNVNIERVSSEYITSISKGKTHGGIVAEVGYRNYQSLEECFSDKMFIVLLEGIEDPFNLGYIARSLVATGCNGILMSKRDFSYSEDVILKSSAQASERINWVMSDDIEKDIQTLKDKGCICVCAHRKDAVSMYDYDFDQSVLLCIGGEMRGLSSKILSYNDQSIMIPYTTDYRNALNASSAVTALSFEVQRQRIKKRG